MEQLLKELRNDLEIFLLDAHAACDRDDRSKARNRARDTREKIDQLLKEHPELA